MLKEFENGYDGSVKRRRRQHRRPTRRSPSPASSSSASRCATAGSTARCSSPTTRPARASTRRTRSAAGATPTRRVAVGMEGAPGHQAAGIPRADRPGGARGFYGSSPSADSFPGYPLESYRTWGGFDWMTSTVGGLWDSLLAEGKPWWITANSDSHVNYLDTAVRGPDSDFDANGALQRPGVRRHADHDGRRLLARLLQPDPRRRDAAASYAAVMDGLRAGRVWVDHGGLIGGLDVRVRVGGDRRDGGTPLGGVAARQARHHGRADHHDRPGDDAELGAVRAEAGPGRRDRRRGHRRRSPTRTPSPRRTPRSSSRSRSAPAPAGSSFTHSLRRGRPAVLRPAARHRRQPQRARAAIGAGGRPGRSGHRRRRRRRPVERPVVLRQPDLGPAPVTIDVLRARPRRHRRRRRPSTGCASSCALGRPTVWSPAPTWCACRTRTWRSACRGAGAARWRFRRPPDGAAAAARGEHAAR